MQKLSSRMFGQITETPVLFKRQSCLVSYYIPQNWAQWETTRHANQLDLWICRDLNPILGYIRIPEIGSKPRILNCGES